MPSAFLLSVSIPLFSMIRPLPTSAVYTFVYHLFEMGFIGVCDPPKKTGWEDGLVGRQHAVKFPATVREQMVLTEFKKNWFLQIAAAPSFLFLKRAELEQFSGVEPNTRKHQNFQFNTPKHQNLLQTPEFLAKSVYFVHFAIFN